MTRGRIVLLGLLLLVGLAYAMRGNLAMRVMSAALPRLMSADPVAELDDGLHVSLCGAGSPLPDPDRSGPCVAVVAGQDLFVVDAGSSAARNLQAVGRPPGRVVGVLLTHFHSDHIDGLGELQLQRWATGEHTSPLPLHGPPGVEEIAQGFNQAYRLDVTYRVAHHGSDTMPPENAGFVARPFPVPTPGKEVVVIESGELRVSAFRVQHAPIDPAVGYRFDYKGRSAVITGDTIRSAEIERMSKGVDVLFHEALAPHMVQLMADAAKEAGNAKRNKIMNDILDYHASPVDAAESAQAAGVGTLVLYHVVPPLIFPGMDVAFARGVSDAYDGDFYVGRDGLAVSLPAGSEAVQVSGD
jgi:ribonuclease Z